MRVIFLDTEFTSAGELIQLSYLMDDGERCRAKNFYFRASEMDEGSQRVHHLTKEFLDRIGVDRDSVRDEILADFSGATLENYEALAEGFACITRLVTAAGSLTAYCYAEKPTVDLSVFLKAVL